METKGSPFKKLRFSIKQERSALLVSIGLSLMLWVFVKLSKTYQSERTVFIEYKLPPMMQFTSPPPSSLEVVVSGSGIDLAKSCLFPKKTLVLLDLGQATSAEEQRSELIAQIQAETGLVVENLNRNSLAFSIDSTATKKVRVVPDLKLHFQRDFFQNGPIAVEPESLLLSGPAQQLDGLDSVFTQPIVIENIDGKVSQTVPVRMDGFPNIVSYPAEVRIGMDAEQFTEKTMEVPISAINGPVGATINPVTAQLTCSVALDRYEELLPDSFRVEVDLGTVPIQPGALQSVPVYVKRSPSWVKTPLVSPKTVVYQIVD